MPWLPKRRKPPVRPVVTAPDPRPFAEQCKRVRTSHGEAAHLQHPELGVICDELHDWPGDWFPAPDSMPLHRRCERAASAVDGAA